MFRKLLAREVECRIQTINNKGLSLLLYKDARADMGILDEMLGPLNWKKKHQIIDGDMFCTVEIWDKEKGEWISKQDVGKPSFSDKEKGRVSDSFKRSCFCLGIGRELYTAPFIWIPASSCNITQRDGKYVCYDKFEVSEIGYSEEGEINMLKIKNDKGSVVYEMNKNSKDNAKQITVTQLQTLNNELNRTGVDMDKVLDRYSISSVVEITQDIYNSAIRSLKKTADKVA